MNFEILKLPYKSITLKEKREITSLDNPSYEDFVMHFLKDVSILETTLKSIASLLKKRERFNGILRIAIKHYPLYFNDLYIKIQTEDFDLLSLYFHGKLNYCKNCGKACTYEYCSPKCSNSSSAVKEKKVKACLEKYGVSNPMQIKGISRHCIFGTEEFKANRKPLSIETRNKIKDTCLERYGSLSPLGSSAIRDKITETVNEKYGVDNVSKLQDTKDKIKQSLFLHYHKNFKDFNLDFIKEHFVNGKTFKINEFMEYYGIKSRVQVNRFKSAFGILERNNDWSMFTSKQEIELFESIECEDKVRNDRSIINPFEIDILLPSIKLGIEFNGSYWHSTKHKDKIYHLNKLNLCKSKGYDLFTIFDYDDIDIWKSMIRNKLKLNTKIYARHCDIKVVETSNLIQFLNDNHLSGYCRSSVNLGLYCNDELVEVMTFSKPRFNKHYTWELIRLCTKKGLCVLGGASKLFKHFRDNYKGSIISYANKRISNGSIYEVLGFSLLSETLPNYVYSNGTEILSRYKCQKSKLKHLPNYSNDKTEIEIMEENGYFQVFDCGNYVFVLN